MKWHFLQFSHNDNCWQKIIVNVLSKSISIYFSGEYFQSQCIGVGCDRCELTHPSCVGLPDGANPYPNRPISPDYILCDDDRTISTEHCNTGLFDPGTRSCNSFSRKFCVLFYICYFWSIKEYFTLRSLWKIIFL